jgi:virulence factor Mce-like protein
MMRKPPRWITGPLVLAVAGAAMFFVVKAAYGGFGHYYDVTMTVPRTGMLLTNGSDVRERGVVIGHVDNERLAGRDVQITLKIQRQYRIPSDAQAYVSLKTLLGAKFVDLRSASFRAPFLADGSRIEAAHVGPELEDALQDGTQVLDALRPNDLATVVVNLAQGAQGHGKDIAQGISAGSRLSTVFAQTLDPQVRALQDFNVIFGQLRNQGVNLNALADAINQGVPVYASPAAQADLDKALRALVPFSQNLADLLILNRSDWDRMMTYGNVVLGAVADRTGGLEDLIHGLYRYVYRLGGPPCTTICGLHDGSAAAGFVNFIGGDSSAQNIAEICGALPPAVRTLVPLCTGVGG